MKLLNALSLNMIDGDCNLLIRGVDRFQVPGFFHASGGLESYVGHTDIANIISNDIAMVVPVNRNSTTINRSGAIVAQYIGPRLAVGTTALPEGAVIKYYHVTAEHVCPDCGELDCDGCE